MIACVSPGKSSADHTINTLRYADRLKESPNSSNMPPPLPAAEYMTQPSCSQRFDIQTSDPTFEREEPMLGDEINQDQDQDENENECPIPEPELEGETKPSEDAKEDWKDVKSTIENSGNNVGIEYFFIKRK